MNREKRTTFFSALFFTFLAAGIARGEVVDKIAIIVNDDVITEGEINRLMEPAYQKYRNAYSGSKLIKVLDDTRQKVIEQLIEDKLMLGEAKRENIDVSDKEVDERLDEAARHFESKKSFEEALADQHIKIKDLRQRYREQLMVKKTIDKKVGSRVVMTPIDVSNYYNSHISEFAVPAEVKLWNILIKPDPVNPQKRYELVREILRRLREGGDFAALAKVYSEGPNASEGGLMGYVRKGDLLPEIEKVVFDMKAGAISGMVQTSLGYHIFKVEDRKETRTLSFPEAHRQVEEAVFRDKIREKAKAWVEGLKKNAYIAFK